MKDKKWQTIRVNLDNQGMYVSCREIKYKGAFDIFITNANGESLINSFLEEQFLPILNESFEVPFNSFKEFLDVNNCKMIINKKEDDKKYKYIQIINKRLDITNFLKFCKLMAKFLVFKLAVFLEIKRIYFNKRNKKEYEKNIFDFFYNKKCLEDTNNDNLSFRNLVEKVENKYKRYGDIYGLFYKFNPAYIFMKKGINTLNNCHYFVNYFALKEKDNLFKSYYKMWFNLTENPMRVGNKIM